MAAETEGPKGGDDEERRTGRDWRRPPLTIDLTAAPATGKAAPTAPESPAASTPASGPTPANAGAAGKGTARGSAAQPASGGPAVAGFDRETWIGYGSVMYFSRSAMLVASPRQSLKLSSSKPARAA